MITVPKELDIIVILTFVISSAIIALIMIRFLSKRFSGVSSLSIYFGIFTLSFAIGEFFEYAEKVTGIDGLGVLEMASTIVGTLFLLIALFKHVKGLIKMGEKILETNMHANSENKK